jgi:hypothetical protein
MHAACSKLPIQGPEKNKGPSLENKYTTKPITLNNLLSKVLYEKKNSSNISLYL